MTSPEPRTVTPERTGWRDQALSERHRQWGWNCPALDVDFLLLEYDRGSPSAIVEFKRENAQPLRLWHPSLQALIRLGDRAGLPVFVVRYAGDFSWWYAQPLNDHAKHWLPQAEHLTERQWVELLYRIRGRELPENLFENDVLI